MRIIERNGYKIYPSEDDPFKAVVEDMDGSRVLVDVSDYEYEDFDGFIDCVMEEFMKIYEEE